MTPRDTTLQALEILIGNPQYAQDGPTEIRNADRVSLAEWLSKLGMNYGVEVGVEAGLYAEQLFLANPNLRLYGVDPWLAYSGYREHVTQEKLDGIFQSAQDRLKAYKWIPKRMTSVAAAQDFQDNELDFVYIDGNHTFVHVVQDLAAWIPKVRSGGIISGHDYIRRRSGPYQNHVVEVVNAWTRAHGTTPWFVIGAQEKVAGERRDNARSFMWVKE